MKISSRDIQASYYIENPTPQQLKIRRYNENMKAKRSPEATKKLQDYKKIQNREYYNNRMSTDPDFIMDERTRKNDERKNMRPDVLNMTREKNREGVSRYNKLIKEMMEKDDLTLDEAKALVRTRKWQDRNVDLYELLKEEGGAFSRAMYLGEIIRRATAQKLPSWVTDAPTDGRRYIVVPNAPQFNDSEGNPVSWFVWDLSVGDFVRNPIKKSLSKQFKDKAKADAFVQDLNLTARAMYLGEIIRRASLEWVLIKQTLQSGKVTIQAGNQATMNFLIKKFGRGYMSEQEFADLREDNLQEAGENRVRFTDTWE